MARLLILDDGQSWTSFLRLTCGLQHEISVRSMAEILMKEPELVRVLQETRPELILLPLHGDRKHADEVIKLIRKSLKSVGNDEDAIATSPGFLVIVGSQDDRKRLEAVYREGGMTMELPLAITEVLQNLALALSRVPVGEAPAVNLPNLVGQGPAMRHILQSILEFAARDQPVLVTGPSGTGKETVARQIHLLRQQRQAGDKTFGVRTAAGVFGDALRQELRGQESVHAGTTGSAAGSLSECSGVYLADVEWLAPDLQVSLLDFLGRQDGPHCAAPLRLRPDARLYFGSCRADLLTKVNSGSFLSGLYQKISACHLTLPPLMERSHDIPLLVNHFLDQLKSPGQDLDIHPEVLELLMNYPWPGNIRQLGEVIRNASSQCQHGIIAVSDLPPTLVAAARRGLKTDGDEPSGTPGD